MVAAVRQLKRGKDTGIDNLPGELIQDGGESVIDLLLKICSAIWKNRRMSRTVDTLTDN